MPLKSPLDIDSSHLFNAIGESHRLKILRFLMAGSQTVQEIGATIKIEKTLLSKHLKALREVGLVRTLRTGRNIHYSINPEIRIPGKKNSLKFHCCEIRLKKI